MIIDDLSVGEKVKDRRSGLTFLVVDKNSKVYNGVPFISEKVIRCACFDAAEPEEPADKEYELVNHYGRNNYALSNIHQWLNSGKTFWYSPSHPKDAPPEGNDHLLYNEQPNLNANGFLRSLSPEFVASIQRQKVPVITRLEEGKGELTFVDSRVFLPSRTELGFGNEGGIAEGTPLPYFADRSNLRAKPTEEQMRIYGRSWNPGWDYGIRGKAELDDPQLFDPKYAWWYWTRTPHLKYSYLVRVMCASGGFSYTMAYNDIVGVRPMLVLDPNAVLDDNGFLI